MSKAVFITGTGTDMGKTYLSGLIVKKLAQAGKNSWLITKSNEWK